MEIETRCTPSRFKSLRRFSTAADRDRVPCLAQRRQGVGRCEGAAGDILVAEVGVGILEDVARPCSALSIVELEKRRPREGVTCTTQRNGGSEPRDSNSSLNELRLMVFIVYE